MITDYHPYVIEQKIGNDFLKDSNYISKKEKSVMDNRHLIIESDVTDFIKLKKTISKDIVYNFNGIFSLKIPFELRYLETAYQKSEYIVLLEKDWDDEGASDYDVEIWKSALTFINQYATKLLLDFNKKIEIPKIYHGPNGSIDILIENDKYSLLMNIASNKATYYGTDHFHNIVKGIINISNINSALMPIAFNF